MEKLFFALGSLSAGIAVALGAFGAHALADRLSERDLQTFETGVRYQFYHAFALLAVAYAINRWPTSSLPVIAGWLFVAGTLIFSGSLYVLVGTGLRWLGAITPIGGVVFIVGWILLAVVAWRS